VRKGAKEGMALRYILDDQHGARGCSGITTEEFDEVGAHVVIVIFEEAQAELGEAGLVDVGEGGGVDEYQLPASGLLLNRATLFMLGAALKSLSCSPAAVLK
jgi:hypothetical protein